MRTNTAHRVSEARLSRGFWPLDLALGLLPFSLVMQALICVVYLPLGLRGLADFRQLYTGGYMIRTGHGSELYSYDAQMRFQRRLFPVASATSLLLITHPAFEELGFVPLSTLPYRSAFWLFFAANMMALGMATRLLWPRIAHVHEQWKWAPLLLIASFFPVSRAIPQGQDSVFLLLLSVVLVYLERGNDLRAGLTLGLGLFKFQVVLPIALLFFLWRRFRFVLGFVTTSVIATLVSLWVIGFRGASMYGRYMLAISLKLSSRTAMVKYADTPLEMLNLRGLLSALLWRAVAHWWVQAFIFIASALVTLAAWRLEASLSLALIATSLVSYHFLAHDASIWLIPILLELSGTSVSEGVLAVGMLLGPSLPRSPWRAFATTVTWPPFHLQGSSS